MPYRSKPRRHDAYSRFTERGVRRHDAAFRGFECRRCGAVFDDKRALFRHKARWCEPRPAKHKADQLKLL
jgi:hypothetical protein